MYLDNQPISTSTGDLDLHMYDINRIEVLPGPQGTLYGAESEAGTIRIITNQPDTKAFDAGYTEQLNSVANGGLGDIAEGFVNLPISSSVAARLVGWFDRQSGFIDNVHQTITFDNGSQLNNAPLVEKDYNPVTTEGGRAAFLWNINDNWSVESKFNAQRKFWDGEFAEEVWKDAAAGTPVPVGLDNAQFAHDRGNDSITDSALTVLGKIGNFDLTYTTGYIKQNDTGYGEYVDYTLAYQQYESFWPEPPLMVAYTRDVSETVSNELRVNSPSDYPVRFTAGLFQERQLTNDVLNEPIKGIPAFDEVGYGSATPWNDTWWLTYNQRVDGNVAGYIQANFDITSHLTGTIGYRRFTYDNTMEGFNGFSLNAFGGGPGLPGQNSCITTTPFHAAPCLDESAAAKGSGSVPLFTLSYKLGADLFYATFSKGFRPGGVNRVIGTPEFRPDYLTNYELGWKTSWFENRMTFDGAVYYETWKNYQFSFDTSYSLPEVANAGDAAVKGVSGNLQWLVGHGLTIGASLAYNDAYLTENYCGALNAQGEPITSNPCVVPGEAPFVPLASAGQKLPYTALWKGFLTARYNFPLLGNVGFVEADQSYQTAIFPSLLTVDNEEEGQEPAFGLTNFSIGMDKGNLQVELLVKNAFNRIYPTDYSLENQADANIVVYRNIGTPRLIALQVSQQF